jgi:phytoene dehydrogenase-like protein
MDVIVVGSSYNGLTAAHYLAKAGQKVLVLERNAWFGGAMTFALRTRSADFFSNSHATQLTPAHSSSEAETSAYFSAFRTSTFLAAD